MFNLFGKPSRDERKPRYEEREEKEIVFSKVVKAGKRVYYLDVKKDRRDDLFLSITESKRKNLEDGQFVYEKHKIFLYKEDFDKFAEGLQEVVSYIRENCLSGGSETAPAKPQDGEKDFSDVNFEEL